jgi:hypothetical protein
LKSHRGGVSYTNARKKKSSGTPTFTQQYIPEDNSEHHTRRRENLKSHKGGVSYTNAREKKALEHRSGLQPSEKEVL